MSDVDLSMLRQLRNNLLQESDWIVTNSLELSSTIPQDWKTYRQKLRDITKTYKSIKDDGFAFPTKPKG